MIKQIYDRSHAAACFFRSTVTPPHYKALLQVTEKCNFKCSHCFVESTQVGNEMLLSDIVERVIPNLIKSNVVKITLTGGEPLIHKDISGIIAALCDNNIAVSICTNGSLITDSFLHFVSDYKNIHFNISLDGLRLESHGRFRGNLEGTTFDRVIENIKKVGRQNLLNGILTTPNNYASVDEYVELCDFARGAGAKYVLMNPLSPFGRGQETQHLAYSKEDMISLKAQTSIKRANGFDVVYIRFPNDRGLPLSGCPLGSFPYIFTNGDVVICPYTSFAAETPDNDYNRNQFLLYNVMTDDSTLQESINRYTLPDGRGLNLHSLDGRGCCAAKIAHNLSLESFDSLG